MINLFGVILLFGLFINLSSCFKPHTPNQYALLQQQACGEAIDLKDYYRARIHCELCLEFDGAMPECLNGLGLVALAEHDQDKAKTFFRRALRQNKDYSEARSNLGVIFFQQGEFTKAAGYFERALEISPSNLDARYNLGLSQLRSAQGSKKLLFKARHNLEKVVALEPGYSQAYYDLGVVMLQIYDTSRLRVESKNYLLQAETYFNRCIENSINHDQCYEGLGQVQMEQHSYNNAFENFFACLSHEPSNSGCRAGIIGAYKKNRQIMQAYKKFGAQIKNNNSNAQAHDAFCAVLLEEGLAEEAIIACRKALDINSGLCRSYFRLAEYYANILDGQNARTYCLSLLQCPDEERYQVERRQCQEIIMVMEQ